MKRVKSGYLCAASALAICTAAASSAFAQTTEVDDVIVTGVRASLRDALVMKRNSDLVVETISSKDIGQLPDVTIAEELDRLPSINATRDRGNDSQAAIRGLGPRLVLGLVNGREVASSEPDRNVRWEIYPSEAVSSVLVYKSQSANLIAGGVAGTIDIRTITPLDYAGPRIVLRAGPVYYDGGGFIPGYNPWGYRASGELVHKLNDDFALSLGASYQEQKNAYASFQGWGYNTPYTGQPGDLNGDGVVDNTPWGAQTEVKQLTEDRFSVTGALQWKPNDNVDVKFDALYSDVKIDEFQNQAWYGRNGVTGNWANGNYGAYNAPGSSYTIVDGDVVAATLPYVSVTNAIAHYTEDKKLFATGLNGSWHDDDWTLTGDLSYSKADRVNKWQAVLTEVYPATLSFDTRAGVVPSVTTSSDPADPNIQTLPSYLWGESDGPEHIHDELFAAQFDASRAFHDSWLTSLDFGGRYSHRTKSHDHYRWYQGPITGALPANLLSEYTVSGFTAPPLLAGDFNDLADAAYGGFTDAPAGSELLNERWKVGEDDFEGYAKLRFGGDLGSVSVKGDAGVRLVHVKTTSDGFEQVNGGALNPLELTHSYTDALPSLNLNFFLDEDRIVRVGLARVMARPPLDELRASRSISNIPPPATGSAGNPSLDPYKASQLDLTYEWYFHPESLASAGVFYKKVDSNIGYFTQPVTIDGVSYAITGPFNGDGGHISGAEFTFQTRFFFLPGVLQDFGIYSNYTYTSSNIKEFTPPNNPLPAVGLAKHTGLVSLWYSKNGFEARVGYKYHSPYTVIYGWNSSQLTTLATERTLDFSASYNVTKDMTVRFQANNLTDEPARFYWNNDPNQLARYDRYGRRYMVDVTVKF